MNAIFFRLVSYDAQEALSHIPGIGWSLSSIFYRNGQQLCGFMVFVVCRHRTILLGGKVIYGWNANDKKIFSSLSWLLIGITPCDNSTILLSSAIREKQNILVLVLLISIMFYFLSFVLGSGLLLKRYAVTTTNCSLLLRSITSTRVPRTNSFYSSWKARIVCQMVVG